MNKIIKILVAIFVTVNGIGASCSLGPEGINLWRLVYQVGSCVQSETEILSTKIDECCSVMSCTMTAIDAGTLSKLDEIVSILESCDVCSNFDLVFSQLDVVESKIDFISVSLFEQIFDITTIIESVLENVLNTVTIIDSVSDVVLSKMDIFGSLLDQCDFCSVMEATSSKIDVLESKTDVCCSVLENEIRSVSDVLGSKIDVGIHTSLDACCATLSVLDRLILSDIDSVSSKIDALGSGSDACCRTLSTLDVIIKSDVDSVSTKVDSVGSQVSGITSALGACCNTLSTLDRIIISDVDSVSTKVDSVSSKVDACCATLSTLDVIIKSDVDSVSSKIDALGSGSDACCRTLSTLDVIIKSDIDSVSTKVDSVGSQVSGLTSALGACCNTLSTLDRIIISDVDSVSTKVDSVSSKVDACCATLSTLDVIIKSDIDSVSTKVDSVGSQVSGLTSALGACCNTLSTLDRIIISDVDSVSTKVDSVSSKVDACCATLSTLDVIIKSDVDSVSSKIDALGSDSDACCRTLSTLDRLILSDIDSVSSKIDRLSFSSCDQTAILSELDFLSSKVMVLESILDFIANEPQAFVSCFGDGVTAGRDEYISIDYQYGTDPYDTTTSTANGGTILTTNSMLTLQTGVLAAGSATVASLRELRYRPGHEGYAFFTAGFLSGGAANSTQWIGLFDAADGMAVGYSGATFSILFRSSSSGVLVDTIVNQANFNVDKLDGTGPSGITLDPTKINIFRVSYGWLGVATLRYEIFRDDCTWHTFQEIFWANANVRPHFSNPVLPMRAQVTNTGNTTNLRLATASWNAGIIGDPSHVAQRIFSISNPGKSVATTEIPLVSIRNNATYNSVSNHIEARLYAFGGGDFGSASSRIILRLRKNATLTGASFTNVNAANSIMSFDTSSTSVSGGTLLLISPAMNGSGGPIVNYLSDLDVDVYMIPGDTLTITAQADTGAGGMNVQGIFTWAELF